MSRFTEVKHCAPTPGKEHMMLHSPTRHELHFHTCHLKRKIVLFLALWALGVLTWEASWDVGMPQIAFSLAKFYVCIYFEDFTFNLKEKRWEKNRCVRY